MTQPLVRTGYLYPRDVPLMRSGYWDYEGTFGSPRPETSPFSLQHDLPSTSYKFGSDWFICLILMRENSTSARTTFIDTSGDQLEEDRTLSDVNLAHANENVFEIRRITGLGWGQLADMLNVDRRTVHNWIKGGRVRSRNRKRIAETLRILRHIDQGSAEENLVLLGKPSPAGLTVLELLKQLKYEEVLRVVSSPVGVRISPSKAAKTGEYQAIAMHRRAEGSESIEPLPFEPQPPARKRELRRV